MDTGITLSTHPPSNIAQPFTMMQTKTAQALSRLLPHNQPDLTELILPQKPCMMREGEWRIITIILTTVRVPASILLSDKKKTGCNSIQSLQQYCNNTKL